MIRTVVCLVLGLAVSCSSAADHAVVLLYHHVSEDTPASTSVSPERFEAHLDYLERNDFEVWPLDRLLEAVIDGSEDVPDKVVAITFDDAYESVHSQAWPMLRERDWPFAVFVNTDAVDAGHSPYLGWDRLRELSGDGVLIGNHSASHGHLIARRNNEGRAAWAERVQGDIERGRRRIAEEIGTEPALFAYPYGEDSQALAGLVARHHDFALAQRSGAVGPHTDRLSVPRFPMASGFDGMERFAMAVNARALPVSEAEPSPQGDGVRDPVETLRLTLADGGYRHAQIGCFSGSGERLQTRLEEGPPHALEIAVGGRGSSGRNKLNCTAPADDGSGDYYWYSYQWVQDAVQD